MVTDRGGKISAVQTWLRSGPHPVVLRRSDQAVGILAAGGADAAHRKVDAGGPNGSRALPHTPNPKEVGCPKRTWSPLSKRGD